VAPEKLGYGMNWPIGYDDVAPWYSHVERFIGVCGNADGLESMPDGEFLPPFDFNCAELHLRDALNAKYRDRHVVQGRWAHLSKPTAIHLQQGRGTCQARNLCMRGCPYGGYFSSVSSTLPWAMKTGNLTIRPDSVVHSIIWDDAAQRATGVRVIDAHTHAITEFSARIIFSNASALNSTLILLNSTSKRFPNGLGNDHGVLGHYVAFHNYRASANGTLDGMTDQYFSGRNPTECILANYRNLGRQDTDFVGGYTTFTGGYRTRGVDASARIGGAYKDAQAQPGAWGLYMYMQGETIPKYDNHVRLHDTLTDPWGIPRLVTSVGYDANDERMIAFAIDLGCEVIPQNGPGSTTITNVKAHKGIVAISRRQTDEKVYKISNKSDSARTMVIEHPNRTNQQFKLVNTPKPVEETTELWRFETKVEAGKSAEYKVTEQRSLGDQITLTNSNDDQIRWVINLNEASPALKAKLGDALKLKAKWDVLVRELQQVRADSQRIAQDQDRIRKNLRETPKEAEVYATYLEKLSAQEKELEALTTKEKKWMADEFKAKKSYEDFLYNIEG
jgi:choline dehydrogenase-like flavoprotein